MDANTPLAHRAATLPPQQFPWLTKLLFDYFEFMLERSEEMNMATTERGCFRGDPPGAGSSPAVAA